MRHRAAMHAVAAAGVGRGPDVEGVMQDALLVAIADVGNIRDPSLARAWLTGRSRTPARGGGIAGLGLAGDRRAVGECSDVADPAVVGTPGMKSVTSRRHGTSGPAATSVSNVTVAIEGSGPGKPVSFPVPDADAPTIHMEEAE